MDKLGTKPDLIFFLSIPVILLIGIMSGGATLDINVHDTYFVIAHFHIAVLISILFGIIGVGYWIMKKANRKLSKWLNWTHIVLTIGGLIAIFGISYLSLGSDTHSQFPYFDELERKNSILTSIIFIVIFGQLMYLINLIIGIFIKNKTDS